MDTLAQDQGTIMDTKTGEELVTVYGHTERQRKLQNRGQ